jgi:hypothetical protein
MLKNKEKKEKNKYERFIRNNGLHAQGFPSFSITTGTKKSDVNGEESPNGWHTSNPIKGKHGPLLHRPCKFSFGKRRLRFFTMFFFFLFFVFPSYSFPFDKHQPRTECLKTGGIVQRVRANNLMLRTLHGPSR